MSLQQSQKVLPMPHANGGESRKKLKKIATLAERPTAIPVPQISGPSRANLG